MLSWFHDLAVWVIHWANTAYGTSALFILAFVESSFFPIPPDVLLIALALINPSNSLYYALICSVGSVLGGAFGFLLGLKGGRPLLLKLFSQEKVHMVEYWFQKYDVWAVGIAGFTPIPYKVFTISAGVFNLDFKRFLVASAISRSARFFLVAGFIALFGPSIQILLKNYFEWITLAFVVLLLGGFYVMKMVAKRMPRRNP
jgi:membrane protein YqaA with SNARE-associated domain